MKKKIYVGGTLRDAGRRFIDAFAKVERGEKSAARSNVTFESWAALAAVMTDKPHEILQHLRQHPAKGIRALSRTLERDYKRVHQDVKALMAAGLIDNRDGTLRANYDEIRATIKLRRAA
jgi:predicted transcriptional regulator